MTLATIEEQEAVFATYFVEVDGITAYLADPPDVINERLLPLAITTALSATYDTRTLGSDSLIVEREWELAILVEDVELGREYTKRALIKPFLTSIPLYVMARREVPIDDERLMTIRLNLGGDRGVNNVRTYGDKTYAVALFRFYTTVNDVVYPEIHGA